MMICRFLYLYVGFLYSSRKRKYSINGLESKHKENSSKNKILTNESTFPKCLNGEILFKDGTKDGPCYVNGAVSSEVPLCSELGVEILRAGGNAVDAAIAATICVGIINSFSSGIGGGGFMLIRIPQKNEEDIVEMIDFREKAPKNIKLEHFAGKTEQSKMGGRAVGVPGEIKGLWEAHQKHGKLKWKDLFTRNIEIAMNFEVSDQLYTRLTRLKNYIFDDPGLKNIYAKDGEIVKPKTIIRRENYANTLRKIAELPNDFYFGEIADNIVESIKKEGGVIEKEDLMEYDAIFREPLKTKFMGYDLYTTNLPTSGLFIIQALNILEHFDIKELRDEGQKVQGSKQFPHYHLLVEIFKFIGAKRGKVQDPDFMDGFKEVVDKITDKKTAEEISKKLNLNGVLDDKEYGFEGIKKDDHGTTHLNVIDKDEMIVSITSTINLEFGAKFMCDKTGIIFNNEINDFYIPNEKNEFDLAEMPNNILKPQKRPFSSAAPFILTKYNEVIILGGAGGTRIPTSLISVIFHLILNKSISEAIAAPRIHNQYHPEMTYIEYGFPDEIKQYLEKIGHKTELSPQNSIFTSVQGIHMIKKKSKEKIIQAISDKRKGGLSSGY